MLLCQICYLLKWEHVRPPARNMPLSSVYYHTQFGRCRSNRMGVNMGSQTVAGALGPPLGWSLSDP